MWFGLLILLAIFLAILALDVARYNNRRHTNTNTPAYLFQMALLVVGLAVCGQWYGLF